MMRMLLLNRRVLACLLCVGLSVACAMLSSRPAAGRRAGRELISEGLGVRGVHLWRSTADDVIAAYGKEFELIEHGHHSYEMKYAARGLAFYYCHADWRKRIFAIECTQPFDGFTAKGIVLGENTLRDVVRAYGQPEGQEGARTTVADETWWYEYPGVQFHVEHGGSGDWPVSRLLGRKIIAIDVVTGETGSDCLPSNLSREN